MMQYLTSANHSYNVAYPGTKIFYYRTSGLMESVRLFTDFNIDRMAG